MRNNLYSLQPCALFSLPWIPRGPFTCTSLSLARASTTGFFSALGRVASMGFTFTAGFATDSLGSTGPPGRGTDFERRFAWAAAMAAGVSSVSPVETGRSCTGTGTDSAAPLVCKRRVLTGEVVGAAPSSGFGMRSTRLKSLLNTHPFTLLRVHTNQTELVLKKHNWQALRSLPPQRL